MHAIGCVAARICSTNNRPAEIATQKKDMAEPAGIRYAGVE
jgi:glutamate synthase domain-containing protein 2